MLYSMLYFMLYYSCFRICYSQSKKDSIMKSCFFIGHREASEEIYPALSAQVQRHYTHLGVREFIVGHYGGFDRLAAKAVKELKKQHPDIILFLLLPYHPAQHPVAIPDGFDNTFYPPGMERTPPKVAIARANRYMVDHTDYLIAYVWHPASNARTLLAYAKKRQEKHLLHITVLENS